MLHNNTPRQSSIMDNNDQTKQQLQTMGQTIKDQMAKDFKDELSRDLSLLLDDFQSQAKNRQQAVLREAEEALVKALAQQLGGLPGDILGGIAPLLSHGFNSRTLRSTGFKQAAAKGLLDIGKAIVKSQDRNG